MKPETKVGLLFLSAIGLVAVFAFYLGVLNPFSNNHELTVGYNFAGGIEVGSPVRVMGIKVGKVKEISFEPSNKMPSGEEVKLLVRIAIEKKAWKTIRKDSQYFINLAGVIGEKFIEITPGAADKEEVQPDSIVRGEDPPRIDQLISQSYGLAGKILELVEGNKVSVADTINMMNNLVTNLNSLLKQIDKTATKKDVGQIVQNLVVITSDMAYFSQQMRGQDGEKTIKLMKELVWRLDALDAKAIRKFLQEEGIKAKMF
jgi:phospholipid/cholesterol/gamma-HCH transport system substrate-binding protein